MMRACPADFARLAGYLGFPCDDDSWFKLRNPLTLANWTMPVVELLMLVGAVLALGYALRRVRRDPTGIAVWLASVAYAVVAELPRHPPDYFDNSRLGVMLVHNVFSVDFVDGRLPLYIVALYPATITLAYDIVRATGVFERRGAAIGALCVGFVHGCVYGVFDHLGPQLRWWVWNTTNPLNHPTLGCVPVPSWVSLAVVGPAAIAFLVQVLIGRRVTAGTPVSLLSLAWRVPLISVLAPVIMGLVALPTLLSARHSATQYAVLGVLVAVFTLVAVPVLVQDWRITRRIGTQYPSPYVRVFGVLYLLTFTVLWMAALPDFAAAIDGVTGAGTPTGNLPCAAVCFVIAGYCIAGVASLRPRTPAKTRESLDA
ncbi:hypothetical protein BOO86_13595 [Mycobacterium sp. CBMA 234]|uniref:hypothetical protein n=1 Tax=Mycolicibacterium sp. CBMA 234 TaxID=1918495 RepID=UPI0012DEEA60|nr:hypothetical protein [Mycolicibacterium sp. CBMA 234]MUL65507.1 hypothetical protein [Mycolicibacterium sp. CBMA 234]